MAEENSQRPASAHPHPWALQIATVAGIPVRLHFTFFLGLLYFGLIGGHGFNWGKVGLILVLFTCVVLHELGHSAVALHYKIPVADITLYPIGGVARIEKRPAPVQEFWIALAGPAVNVVIALALWAYLGFYVPQSQAEATAYVARHQFVVNVLAANIWLVLFNAIPAFPMDGGRVLRSILAMNMPAERATAIAASIGQFLAILFGVAGFFADAPILMFIAFFVYIGAGQEAVAYRQMAFLQGVLASQAMMTDIRTLTVGNTLKEATDVLLSTSQRDFPVVLGETVQGVLTRDGLLRGLSEHGAGAYVAGVMNRDFASVAPGDDLSVALPQLQDGQGVVLVMDPLQDGKLLGVISGENVAEYFAVRAATAARS